MMTAHLRDHHVAGAVVTVVARGESVLSKGYGYTVMAAPFVWSLAQWNLLGWKL